MRIHIFSCPVLLSPPSLTPFLHGFLLSPISPFLHGIYHPGDTPNCITDAEFESMGEVSEGYSGSDIAIVVRQVEDRR